MNSFYVTILFLFPLLLSAGTVIVKTKAPHNRQAVKKTSGSCRSTLRNATAGLTIHLPPIREPSGFTEILSGMRSYPI